MDLGNPWWTTFGSDGLREIAEKSNLFVAERGWQSHDTERNLAMAVCAEAGELVEILAWKGDEIPKDIFSYVVDRVGQELADIVILVVRLAAKCKVDLHNEIQEYIKRKEDSFLVLAV